MCVQPGKAQTSLSQKGCSFGLAAPAFTCLPHGVLRARTLTCSALWRPRLPWSGDKGAQTSNIEGSGTGADTRYIHTRTHTLMHTHIYLYTHKPTEFTQLSALRSYAPRKQLGNTLNCRMATIWLPDSWVLTPLRLRKSTPPIPFIQPVRQRPQAASALLAPSENTLSSPCVL